MYAPADGKPLVLAFSSRANITTSGSLMQMQRVFRPFIVSLLSVITIKVNYSVIAMGSQR